MLHDPGLVETTSRMAWFLANRRSLLQGISDQNFLFAGGDTGGAGNGERGGPLAVSRLRKEDHEGKRSRDAEQHHAQEELGTGHGVACIIVASGNPQSPKINLPQGVAAEIFEA